jgi:hypothetical protein
MKPWKTSAATNETCSARPSFRLDSQWSSCGPTAHRGAFSDSASRTFCRLGPTAHRSVWRCKRMLLPALGLPCFRTPRADVVGEPMLEAPRKIQQIAGRNACYGRPPRARLSTPGQCHRRAEGGDETATNPRGKWRFSPTFRGVMRWRTKDAPDHAMRCRLAGNLSGKATCTQ